MMFPDRLLGTQPSSVERAHAGHRRQNGRTAKLPQRIASVAAFSIASPAEYCLSHLA